MGDKIFDMFIKTRIKNVFTVSDLVEYLFKTNKIEQLYSEDFCQNLKFIAKNKSLIKKICSNYRKDKNDLSVEVFMKHKIVNYEKLYIKDKKEIKNAIISTLMLIEKKSKNDKEIIHISSIKNLLKTLSNSIEVMANNLKQLKTLQGENKMKNTFKQDLEKVKNTVDVLAKKIENEYGDKIDAVKKESISLFSSVKSFINNKIESINEKEKLQLEDLKNLYKEIKKIRNKTKETLTVEEEMKLKVFEHNCKAYFKNKPIDYKIFE